MTRVLHVTTLTEWRSGDDGTAVPWEQIALGTPDGRTVEVPIVRIPEGWDRWDPAYRALRDRSEAVRGEVMKETLLVMWGKPQRYFVAMADRDRIAELNELWSNYERPLWGLAGHFSP
jgi:hypothetical protein